MHRGRNLLTTGLICVLSASSAFGANALFAPPSDIVPAGTPIVVDMTLSLEALTDFDFAYLVIGSDDATDLSFAYDADWLLAFQFGSVEGPTYDDGGYYLQEVTVGGDNYYSPVGYDSLALGTLTIDTTAMANGDYTVVVDYDQDQNTSEMGVTGGEHPILEPINGAFDFTIVPEPGAFALLALGGLALLRRRR